MYSFTCSYVLRTFLLFPFLRITKKKWQSKGFFFQDKMKAIYKTEIFASIIKHTIIHVNM